MPELTRETIVPFLADIFARRGGEEYLGEPVTMAQHMLQGATLVCHRQKLCRCHNVSLLLPQAPGGGNRCFVRLLFSPS